MDDPLISKVYRELGARIRRYRVEAGLSQAALAGAVNASRTSIANLEAGRQRPPLHVLYQIAGKLERPLADLLPSLAELEASIGAVPLEVSVGTQVRPVDRRTVQFLNRVIAQAGQRK